MLRHGRGRPHLRAASCEPRVLALRWTYTSHMSDSLLLALASRSADAALPQFPIADGDESVLARYGDDSNDDSGNSSDSFSRSSTSQNTSFTLNGETWEFENAVPLVLAAARQLGMAIGRDASLLWIADEALLDEYDEEDTPLKVPVLRELPLSEDVCAYYSNIFRERSKPLRLDIGDETTSAKLAAHRHLESLTGRGQRRGRSSKRSKEKESKKERQRRRLDLREARLSGITERRTEEMSVDVTDEHGALTSSMPSDGQGGQLSASSPTSPLGAGPVAAPAVWPSVIPDFPPTGIRMRGGTLPRIDSASMALDQMEQMYTDSSQAGGVGGAAADAIGAAALQVPDAVRESTNGEPALDTDSATFRKGDCVEVDFDDEGWMRGVVESVRAEHGVAIYSVRMQDGEIAEDVEGSEIRVRGDQSDGSSEGGDSYAHTRSEGFSAFDQKSVLDADTSPQAERRADTTQMRCHATDSGIQWDFIDAEQLNWSPPTEQMLQAHLEAQRRREELNRSPP